MRRQVAPGGVGARGVSRRAHHPLQEACCAVLREPLAPRQTRSRQQQMPAEVSLVLERAANHGLRGGPGGGRAASVSRRSVCILAHKAASETRAQSCKNFFSGAFKSNDERRDRLTLFFCGLRLHQYTRARLLSTSKFHDGAADTQGQ